MTRHRFTPRGIPALGLLPPALWPSPLPRAATAPHAGAAAVSAIYDALSRGDTVRVTELLGPDVSWFEADGMPYAAAASGHHGADEVAAHVLAPLAPDVSGLTWTTHELLTYGDTVVALGTSVGRDARTGAELVQPYAHIWVLAGTTVVAFRQYTDVHASTAIVDSPATSHVAPTSA